LVDVAVAPGKIANAVGVALGALPATPLVGVRVLVLTGPTVVIWVAWGTAVGVAVAVGGTIWATGGATFTTGATATEPGTLMGVCVRRAISVARKFGSSGSGAAKLRSAGKGAYAPKPVWAATSLNG
jgi:hypothetical protein